MGLKSRNLQGYEKDIQLELRFADKIKEILGKQFITKDKEWDVEKATDFLVFTIKPLRVAVRLRRYSQYLKAGYKEEFTIRWSRPSGKETEIHKIQRGYVDYLFYGFVNGDETKIIQYFIGDLNVFRRSNVTPIAILPNKPPDSDFAVYKINQFPQEFILNYTKHLNLSEFM